MKKETTYQSDVLVVGGGIAGLVATYELLNAGKSVTLLDRDTTENLGGLAKWAFGGMFFVNSEHQKKRGIQDSIDLALKDWFAFAEYETGEIWGKKWAEQYIHYSTPHGYNWLKKQGIGFFPVVHWVERGLFQPGNSVPRFHMVWGTGWELAKVFKNKVLHHPNKDKLKIYTQHRVNEIIIENQTVKGVQGIEEISNQPFFAFGEQTIIATGGINGSIEKVKKHWYKPWGEPPEIILNGSHQYAIGDLHDAAERINGSVVNLDKQWNYAAGIRHYNPRKPEHGLSLVPCKSAIWTNYQGKRFGPMPLITAYDTRYLVQRICEEPVKYSWQILNMKIAYKEFAISGSEHNEAMRDKNLFGFAKNILLGNKKLVHKIIDNCEDVVMGHTFEELAQKMNALTGENHVNADFLRASIEAYDRQIDRGPAFHNDEQLRRIAHARQYRGDKVRTCNFQKIMDKKAMPLIAIREFILSRKSLGGIQTDLETRVLTTPNASGQQEPIEGLYAIGEAAGFGGGGMHGHRSLEGTFLGGCIITARVAARAITGVSL